MEQEKFAVALTKLACPLCGKEVDDAIVMNKRLSRPEAEKVKAMHGKCTGYMDKPCDKCQDMMKQGILIIGYVEEKSGDMSNPYRSGNNWVIKKDRAIEIFGEDMCSKGAFFLSTKVAVKMDFPDVNVNA